MTITFRDDFTVQEVDSMGSDLRVVQAARTSTKGAEAILEDGGIEGLIRWLIKNRHGSPFEHTVFTWLITCPIFVWREFMRHRIASYNEESGRYTVLKPVFYIPCRERPLQQIGKTGAYEFIPGTDAQYKLMVGRFKFGARQQYETYEELLNAGIAKEVSRMELPLNIYSTAMVTMNGRALMNFLSLRTKHENSAYPSFPQWEINQVANQMEEMFKRVQPVTWEAFSTIAKRVQP